MLHERHPHLSYLPEDEFAPIHSRCPDVSEEEEEEESVDNDDVYSEDAGVVAIPKPAEFYRHGDFVRVLLACFTKVFGKKMRAGICIFWENGNPHNRAWALTGEEKLTRAQVQVLGKNMEPHNSMS